MSHWTYRVRGMTCGHCAGPVTKELEGLDGVTGVTVDLVPEGDSTVTLTGSAEVAHDAVRGAIQRAGYELVDPPSS